jgi:RNA polymerase sigma-B factor
MQVGYVGLLKAINNYDPSFGSGLKAYAEPCISGEIKRHFRDKRWQIRVTRPLQELLLEMRGAVEELTHELGRLPDDHEVASRLGVTPAELREARQAADGFSALSLNAPMSGLDDPAELAELLGEEDPAVDQVVSMEAVTSHWEQLPRREQRILLMRFYGNLTQEQIASQLGISQMHVSRLQARALARLRDWLSGEPCDARGETALPAGPRFPAARTDAVSAPAAHPPFCGLPAARPGRDSRGPYRARADDRRPVPAPRRARCQHRSPGHLPRGTRREMAGPEPAMRAAPEGRHQAPSVPSSTNSGGFTSSPRWMPASFANCLPAT